jgi:hypothetical protein
MIEFEDMSDVIVDATRQITALGLDEAEACGINDFFEDGVHCFGGHLLPAAIFFDFRVELLRLFFHEPPPVRISLRFVNLTSG